MAENNTPADSLSRRKFLEASTWVLSGGIATGLGSPAAYYLLTPILLDSAPSWVDLGDAVGFRSATAPIEVRFSYQSSAGYVRRRRSGLLLIVADTSADDLLVLSPICTHMGCNVSWAADESLFACPCHGGRYDTLGNPVSGPPQRALANMPTKIEKGRLFALIPTT